jgi:hypothetical protein
MTARLIGLFLSYQLHTSHLLLAAVLAVGNFICFLQHEAALESKAISELWGGAH